MMTPLHFLQHVFTVYIENTAIKVMAYEVGIHVFNIKYFQCRQLEHAVEMYKRPYAFGL